MALFIYIDGVDRASNVRLTEGFQTSSAAELGTVGVATIQVDDPGSLLDIVGWKSAYIVETSANPIRIWTGFIGARTIERGRFRNGSDRVWTCEAVDINWNLTRRVIRSANGKRDAETDLARLTWLLGHASLSGLVYQGALTNLTDNPVNLGEADYRGQYPMNVLADMAPVAGKTAWVRWDNGRPELFYDLNDATTDDSTLRISNLLSDVDSSVTFAPLIDASLSRSPEQTYSGILLEYQKGYLYTSNSTTADTYADRDLSVSTTRIGSTATAQTYSDTVLEKRGVEENVITVSIEVPRANVNDVREGQRCQVKFTHLPDLGTTFHYRRVVRKQVQQREQDDSAYLIQLDLTDDIKGPLNAGDPGEFPHVPTTPGIVQQVSGIGNITLPSPITEGNTLVYVAGFRSGSGASGWVAAAEGYTKVQPETSFSGGYEVGIYYKLAGASEDDQVGGPGASPNSGAYGTWYELPGEWTPSAFAEDANTGSLNALSGNFSAPASSISFGVIGYGLNDGAYDSGANLTGYSFTSGTGWTEDGDGHPTAGGPSVTTQHQIRSAAGTITADATHSGVDVAYRHWAAQGASFVGDSTDNPPSPGQPVGPETVVMSGTTGTTAYPYADGSLKGNVRVDGVLISAANVIETDPAAGTFDLTWETDTDEVVTVSYMGR